MPSKQARKPTTTPSTAASRRPGQSSPPSGSARQSGTATGESDPSFNLVSVLYHALQGADTAARYQQDAQLTGSDEMTDFFEQTRAEYTARAAEAKRLLAKMIGASAGEEEDELSDEDEEDEDEDEDD